MPANETPNPCPWCGESALALALPEWHWVTCRDDDCGATGPIKDTEPEAIAAWNRVAKPKEQTAPRGQGE